MNWSPSDIKGVISWNETNLFKKQHGGRAATLLGTFFGKHDLSSEGGPRHMCVPSQDFSVRQVTTYNPIYPKLFSSSVFLECHAELAATTCRPACAGERAPLVVFQP